MRLDLRTPLALALLTLGLGACLAEGGERDLPQQTEPGEPGEPTELSSEFVQDSELAFPGRGGTVEQGFLLVEEPTPIAYEVIDGLRVFEGDILLDDAIVEPRDDHAEDGLGSSQQELAVMATTARRWSGGVMPYVFASNLSAKSKQDALDAMAHIRAKTSLDFVARTNQSDYVEFVDGSGCSSYVGRIGGKQAITLEKTCGFGAAVHEVVHALGGWHEQQRVDRGDVVKILWDNIEEGRESNFEQYLPKDGDELTSYDLGSIMHYGPYSFSKNGKATIVRASDSKPYEHNRSALSSRDIAGLQLFYGDLACGCAEGKVCNPQGACVTFLDVPASHTHARNIDRLAEANITKGCGTHVFCPSEAVTREQMATFLVRALGLTPKSGSHFKDVDANNAHAKNIYALAAAGITKGCAADKFCPKNPVTRAQMASFLVRALGLTPKSGSYFSDVPAGSPHAKDINALYLANITTGCGGGKYCPDGVVTRAQMATFLVRAFDL